MADVMILMGSLSDREKVLPCGEILDGLGLSWRLLISSAHRSPERTVEIVREAESNGTMVFICAAGMAAHLAGAVAAHTVRPVIGIPLSGSSLCGMDALFSTVQMPGGFPVATVALDKAGSQNAAWLAAEIIAINRPGLAQLILHKREEMRLKLLAASEGLERELHKSNHISSLSPTGQ